MIITMSLGVGRVNDNMFRDSPQALVGVGIRIVIENYDNDKEEMDELPR